MVQTEGGRERNRRQRGKERRVESEREGKKGGQQEREGEEEEGQIWTERDDMQKKHICDSRKKKHTQIEITHIFFAGNTLEAKSVIMTTTNVTNRAH